MGIFSTIVGVVSPPAGLALKVFGAGKNVIGSTWKAVTASSTSILATLAALAFMALAVHDWYGRHEGAKALKVQHSELVAAQRDNREWQSAFDTLYGAEQNLYRALTNQNETVTYWHNRGEAAQRTAQSQLDAAKGRWASAESRAAAARAEATAQVGNRECASGPAARATKGDF